MIPTEGATVIGREAKFRGEISGSTDLIIDGEVDGTIRLTGAKLTVRPDGRVKATISAQDVAIAGTVGVFAFALLMTHLFYRPLDVLWYEAIRTIRG